MWRGDKVTSVSFLSWVGNVNVGGSQSDDPHRRLEAMTENYITLYNVKIRIMTKYLHQCREFFYINTRNDPHNLCKRTNNIYVFIFKYRVYMNVKKNQQKQILQFVAFCCCCSDAVKEEMWTPGALRAATHLARWSLLSPPPAAAPAELLQVTLGEKKQRGTDKGLVLV